jgi:phenylpropionate dioxygenase-like ring-hydroxylating dioxygenase large terminal subunit
MAQRLIRGRPSARGAVSETASSAPGDRCAYSLDGFTTRRRHSATLHANWKIVVDAFNETWHVPFTHKDTLSDLVRWREAVLRITSPHSWMTIPVNGFTENATGSDHRRTHLCRLDLAVLR